MATTASNYNWSEISQAQTAIGATAGKFGSAGDAVPQSPAASMFGTMANSGAVASAVSALCASLRTEFSAAENLVGEIERAMDAMQTTTTGTDTDNQDLFESQQA